MGGGESALAAAGFELPPDKDAYDKRRDALKLAVDVAQDLALADANEVVSCANAFLAFLLDKPAPEVD